MTYISIKDSIETNQKNFNSKIEDINSKVVANLKGLEADILGFRTFFHASLSLESDQFRLYANDLLSKNKALKEVYYLPIINESERISFTSYMRKQGYPTFKIYRKDSENKKISSKNKETYYPIKFLEPIEPWTAGLLGYDLSSVGGVKSTIDQAINTGKPISLSGSNFLKGGIILLTATYAGKQKTPDNAVERRKSANGTIVFKFSLKELLKDSLNTSENIKSSIRLQNLTENSKEKNSEEDSMLFTNYLFSNEPIGNFYKIKNFKFGENIVHIDSVFPFFRNDLITPFVMVSFLGSFIFSGLFILFTYNEMNKANKVRILVEEKTQELSETNSELVSLNNSVTAMLESLGPALLFFDVNGICSDTYSDSCMELLESEPAKLNIVDILKLNDTKKEQFLSLISFAFENKSAMSFNDIFAIAPKKYAHSLDKFIQLEYRPIYNADKKVENILVIATDRTNEEITKNIIEEKKQYSEKIIRLIHSKDDYAQTLKQFSDYFLNGKNALFLNEENVMSMKQNIHTLKGLVGSFSLQKLLQITHNLEDKLKLIKENIGEAKNIISNDIEEIKDLFTEELNFSSDILGYNVLKNGAMRNVSYDDLLNFHHLLVKKENAEVALNFYNSFLTLPIFEVLEFLDFHLQETANLLNKKISPCLFEGENIQFPLRKYDSLLSSLVHLVRNSVDHGIESPKIRKEKEKPEAGTFTIFVAVKTEKNKKWLHLSFSDDGKGIDIEALKDKLKSNDIDTDLMSDEEIMRSVFDDSISSKNEISTVSGRGIGLSAVKENVEKYNGRIRVSSSLGLGTNFIIQFPFEY